METYSKENLKIIQDAMEYIGIKMGIFTREHGRMMWNKDLVSWNSPMDNIIKANFQKGINMGRGFINGQMEMNIKDIFNWTRGKD